MSRPNYDMRVRNSKTAWKPTKMLATCCNSVIFSKYPGQYAQCKCGESFVDETESYSRSRGKLELYVPTELEKELE
jgi:hypothetical protein